MQTSTIARFLFHLDDQTIARALNNLEQETERNVSFSDRWVCFCVKCCFTTDLQGSQARVWWALAERGHFLKKWSRYYHSKRGFSNEIGAIFQGHATYLTPSLVHMALLAERQRRQGISENINVSNTFSEPGGAEHTNSPRLLVQQSDLGDYADFGGDQGPSYDTIQGFSDLACGLPRNDGADVISLGVQRSSDVPAQFQDGVLQVRYISI